VDHLKKQPICMISMQTNARMSASTNEGAARLQAVQQRGSMTEQANVYFFLSRCRSKFHVHMGNVDPRGWAFF
jgi:hypothetical protein